MPRREDILSRIDVTIMDRSAHTALPSSYSKTFPAFRTGAAATHAAGLGGKRFIDFIEPHSCVSAFIPKHGSKLTPPRIEHRLRERSLCQGGSIHIANDDLAVRSHQACAELVQKILPPIRNLGVNRPGASFISRPLSFGKLRLQVAIEALGLDRWQVRGAEGSEFSQAQVNAEARNRSIQNRCHRGLVSLASRSLSGGYADIQIPATSGILAEVPRTQFKVLQTITVPEREPASRKVDLPRLVPNRSYLEGNPPQRATHAAAFTPSQPYFSMLSASPRVFLGNLLHRLHGQIQPALTTSRTFQKRPIIVAGQEAPFALEYLDRQFVAVIEHGVDLAGQRGQPRRMLVLEPHAQDSNWSRSSDTGHAYSIAISRLQYAGQTVLNTEKRKPPSPTGLQKTGVSRGDR